MAGRIPESFIDELLNRLDIVEVIDARVPLKKAGREFQACCPFHNEKTPSFTVSPAKQFYHCFGCGAHGSAIGFLMEYEHLDFIDAVEELARSVGLEVPREAGRPAPGHGHLHGILAEAAEYYRRQLREHPQRGAAVDYLKQRGLSGDIARDFGIGYAPPGWDNLLRTLGADETRRRQLSQTGMLIERDEGGFHDRFRDRIMFPIRDRRGRTIGFGGRVLGDGKPKYLNSPETPVFHKGRELYGLFEASQALRKLERLLVVEGYMDVVALAQFGIRYAVATLGTATTPEHLERMFRLVPEVVFCFDGDRAGREAAWRALENTLPVMREGRQARFLFLPEGEDPDSLVRKEGQASFEARIARADVFSEYLFKHLASQADMNHVEGRARLVELARPLLQKIPQGIYRDMLMDRLAEISHVDRGRMRSTLEGKTPAMRVVRPARGVYAPSPVRHAITLLVQYPELAAQVEDATRLAALEQPGADLLAALVELLHRRPDLTTAAILEHWRGEKAAEHLARLAMVRLDIPEEGLHEEFADTLARLEEQHAERRIGALLEKSRLGQLSGEEKQELQRLLAARSR